MLLSPLNLLFSRLNCSSCDGVYSAFGSVVLLQLRFLLFSSLLAGKYSHHTHRIVGTLFYNHPHLRLELASSISAHAISTFSPTCSACFSTFAFFFLALPTSRFIARWRLGSSVLIKDKLANLIWTKWTTCIAASLWSQSCMYRLAWIFSYRAEYVR